MTKVEEIEIDGISIQLLSGIEDLVAKFDINGKTYYVVGLTRESVIRKTLKTIKEILYENY